VFSVELIINGEILLPCLQINCSVGQSHIRQYFIDWVTTLKKKFKCEKKLENGGIQMIFSQSLYEDSVDTQ